jgi:hypothetical protein
MSGFVEGIDRSQSTLFPALPDCPRPRSRQVATLVTNDVISIEGDQRVLRRTGE